MTRFPRLWTLLVGEDPLATLCALADREKDAAAKLNCREGGRLRKARRDRVHAELGAYVSGLLRRQPASDPLAAPLSEQPATNPKGSR